MSETDKNQATEHRSLKEIMRESFTDAFWESLETWVLQWVEDEYRAVKRIIQGMRYAVLLLVVVLILGLITELLWSLVAIVWLVNNTRIAPWVGVLGIGLVVGVVVATILAFVYMRR